MIKITIESGKIVIETDEMPQIIHQAQEPEKKEDDCLAIHKKGKICPQCGKHYIQTGNAQVYCSPECKENAKKLKAEVDRAIIESPKIDELKETIGNAAEKTHPEMLDEIIARKKETGICPGCGKVFEKKHPYQKYCCPECRNEAAKKNRELKLKSEIKEEIKSPSLMDKIPLFVEKLKATFFVNKYMTEEQKEEYKREKIRQHEESLKQ
jgi:predicted RNA-binding Zn-ribbon protein involved in translation (DUF1610 family)